MQSEASSTITYASCRLDGSNCTLTPRADQSAQQDLQAKTHQHHSAGSMSATQSSSSVAPCELNASNLVSLLDNQCIHWQQSITRVVCVFVTARCSNRLQAFQDRQHEHNQSLTRSSQHSTRLSGHQHTFVLFITECCAPIDVIRSDRCVSTMQESSREDARPDNMLLKLCSLGVTWQLALSKWWVRRDLSVLLDEALIQISLDGWAKQMRIVEWCKATGDKRRTASRPAMTV